MVPLAHAASLLHVFDIKHFTAAFLRAIWPLQLHCAGLVHCLARLVIKVGCIYRQRLLS